MNILGTEQEWQSSFTVEQLRALAFESIGNRCSPHRQKADLIQHIRMEWARRFPSVNLIQPLSNYENNFHDHIRRLAQLINTLEVAYISSQRTSQTISTVR